MAELMRDVDWTEIAGALEQPALRSHPEHSGQLGHLLLALQALPKDGSVQDIAHQVLSLFRRVLGVERAALFLRSRSGQWLQGTVGTGLGGEVTDERGIRYLWGACDEDAHADLHSGKRAWSLLDNAPLMTHDNERSRVGARGWLVKTPVAGLQGPLGMFHNDPGLSKVPFSAELQDKIAFALQVVGPILERAQARGGQEHRPGLSKSVRRTQQLLLADPSLSHEALAEKVGLLPPRLSRLFAKEMGVSLIDYRNGVRLDCFFKLVDERERRDQDSGLLELALASGFGSYAQFHRVFTKTCGRSPRQYLNP